MSLSISHVDYQIHLGLLQVKVKRRGDDTKYVAKVFIQYKDKLLFCYFPSFSYFVTGVNIFCLFSRAFQIL